MSDAPIDAYRGACAARSLALDRDVYESERATGHRNRAIGHVLRGFGVLETDPGPELYFPQGSVAVSCRDLALGRLLPEGAG